MKLRLALSAALLMAAPASAGILTGLDSSNEDSGDHEDFARCVYARQPREVGQAVDAFLGAPMKYGIKYLAQDFPFCEKGIGPKFSPRKTLLVGAFSELILKKQSADLDQLDGESHFSTSVEDGLINDGRTDLALGVCAVRESPTNAKALLFARAGSTSARRAFEALTPFIQHCKVLTKSDAKLFSRPSVQAWVRAWIAIAAYQSSQEAAAASNFEIRRYA